MAAKPRRSAVVKAVPSQKKARMAADTGSVTLRMEARTAPASRMPCRKRAKVTTVPNTTMKATNNHIIAAFAVDGLAEVIVDFLSAVKTENNVVALLVGKLNYIVVNKHTIGCKRKAEVLVVLLLDASGVGYNLFDHIEIHQRFAAEEVDLQIYPAS